ncbi:hypothetical protein FTV88_1216 [Heliorestis convoluta]|uniref:Uncharacterized protein n=1 Tax=Heliorestis convoluta TaxID=356322 RepID=A0A5Q2N0R5_9FIRM|nr:hypothetical protein FTV88_1216 [Heliorestis convoluta]
MKGIEYLVLLATIRSVTSTEQSRGNDLKNFANDYKGRTMGIQELIRNATSRHPVLG